MLTQAGQKRTKSLDEPEVVAVVQPKASPSDGGAKQALENEFECTICRVSDCRAFVDFCFFADSSVADCVLVSFAGLHGGHTLSCALWSHVLWGVLERMVAKEPLMS